MVLIVSQQTIITRQIASIAIQQCQNYICKTLSLFFQNSTILQIEGELKNFYAIDRQSVIHWPILLDKLLRQQFNCVKILMRNVFSLLTESAICSSKTLEKRKCSYNYYYYRPAKKQGRAMVWIVVISSQHQKNYRASRKGIFSFYYAVDTVLKNDCCFP